MMAYDGIQFHNDCVEAICDDNKESACKECIENWGIVKWAVMNSD